MTLVIVQPARNPEGIRNYAKTVDSPISLQQTAQHLSAQDQAVLEQFHPSGAVPVWGTTRGERGQMETRWARIASGDVVLFTGKNEVYKVARVTHAFRSASLADQLWEPKTTANGHRASWEFMYAFNQPVDVSIPYDPIKALLEQHGLGFPTREFSVLSQEQSDLILGYLEENATEPPAQPSPGATREMVKKFDQLEKEYTAQRRAEQDYLRQYLLSGSSGECLLCGRAFSKDFLVAAHIKKRSKCSDAEKVDIPAIAMLACKFGCDELFERGMIIVSAQGKISHTHRLIDSTARLYVNEHLKGRSIASWDGVASSHQYFEYHHELWN